MRILPIIIHAYKVEIDRDPKPRNEIEECLWVDRNYKDFGITLGSIMAENVIPLLSKHNLIERWYC